MASWTTWATLAGILVAGPGASAEPQEPLPEVELEQLLKLPPSLEVGSERRGGETPDEWRRRFEQADAEIETIRHSLERTQNELEHTAADSSNWQVAAPGAKETENSPLSFRLREEIRDQRDELDRAQKRRRDLDIEADLAGVPGEWRSSATEAPRDAAP